ncbi:hypothetical protein [Miltoncostaea oceani]|jgi:hypothetical protein|uniref:hypothetical protein n=1 Tax=Miltoncostaea oceani TaxID=2843216 RepID=UPI001C3D57D3|nr:hypothetical protein [Miltoncostaea oceani]
MRGAFLWVGLIIIGLGAVIGLFAIVGTDDHADEQVSAAEWSADVCGAVLVWRGQMESIVDDIRQPTAIGDATSEPQSETEQTRTGFIRSGLERAVQATDTLTLAIETAGIPDSPGGAESADALDAWSSDARDELDAAQDALDEEADTLEAAVEQLASATRSLGTALAGGVDVIAEVAVSDPQLAVAVRNAPTCRTLQEERAS